MRDTRGITLIALIITIIVLVILAGVSISMLSGENGILTKATEAKEKQVISMEKEQIAMAYLICQMNLSNSYNNKVTEEELKNELMIAQNDVTVYPDTSYLYVTFNNTRHKYSVDENGNITYLEDKENDTSQIDANLQKQSISYQDSMNPIMNPDRGFYRPVKIILNSDTFSTKYNDMQTECTRAKEENLQILHLRINIEQLSGNANSEGIDKNFTDRQITSLNTLFNTIRENNLSVVVRFAYDFDGNIGREPKSFDTITNHIKQLSSFFDTNKDIISTVEAGFLGPYGEMHTAQDYQEDNYYKNLIETLLDNTQEEIKINVRKPYFYKIVVGNLDNSQRRLGIFNDGYLGSDTDLGTFDNGITRADFVNWMQTHGKYTLYGGEATKRKSTDSNYKPENEPYSDSDFAIEEMPKTHTAYLNSQFNSLILEEKWQNQTYINSNSEYNGTTAYKYISDHLGYRLIVRDSTISSSVKKGAIVGVKAKIENVGFGNIVKNQKATVILRKDNIYYETEIKVNANDFDSGEITDVNFYFYVPSNINDGEWKVYLKFANKNNSDYAIQFANPDIWDSDLLANNIGKIVIEDTVDREGIKFKQAFVENASEGTQNTITVKEKTVLVEFVFYDHSNEDTEIDRVGKNIILGTNIDFLDSNSMETIGISIPDGYRFSYAQCPAIIGDWSGVDSIKIPNETSESKFRFYVFFEKIN